LIRYRPTISVKTIQEKLAFEDEEECNKFLNENGAIFAESFPTESNMPLGMKKNGKIKRLNQKPSEDKSNVDPKLSLGFFMEAMKKYKKVDIKGQL
jgi:hypothetical protein